MAISGADIGDIKPEEGKSIEFGSKFQNDSITASVAVSNINKKNIMRTVDGVSTPVGEARSRGFEFDFNGRVTQGLSLGASYAYTKTRCEKIVVPMRCLLANRLRLRQSIKQASLLTMTLAILAQKG